MAGLREGSRESVTPLSRVITSFHPIERHSIHPHSADPNLVRQAGQRQRLDMGTGRRRRWGQMKREGWTVSWQGYEGGKEGKVAGKRGLTSPLHINLKSASRPSWGFGRRKESPSGDPNLLSPFQAPPLLLASVPLFSGHLWVEECAAGALKQLAH